MPGKQLDFRNGTPVEARDDQDEDDLEDGDDE